MIDNTKKTFLNMRVLQEALKDISFLEEILRILLFDESLTLVKCEEDKLISIEGNIVFSYDFVAFGKERGIYGICLLDCYEKEMRDDFLFLHGLLRNAYDKENRRDDIYTLCFCKGEEEKRQSYYIPEIDLIEMFGKYEFIDKGIRFFVFQKIAKPASMLESVMNDFACEEISDIRNEFIREKLEWTLWELKYRK